MMKNNFKKIDLANNLSRKKGFSVLFSKKIIDDLIETLIFGSILYITYYLLGTIL